jgi:cytochrome c-type biogenesis protein CcmH/NrfG
MTDSEQLMLFVDDLLMLPFTGFKSILRTLVKVAEEQYTDDAPVKERLLQLQVELDEGKITEDEYVQQEAAILRELREIQNRKRELAGLPPEEATGLSGKVKEGSGVELTWDPNSEDNVGPGR